MWDTGPPQVCDAGPWVLILNQSTDGFSRVPDTDGGFSK